MNIFKQGFKSLNPYRYDQLIANPQKSTILYLVFLSTVFSLFDILLQMKTYQELGVKRTLMDFLYHSIGHVFEIAILTLVFGIVGILVTKGFHLDLNVSSVMIAAAYSLTIQFILVECTMVANIGLNIEIKSFYSIIIAFLFLIFVLFRLKKTN